MTGFATRSFSETGAGFTTSGLGTTDFEEL
jgi:hypothetical protein